MHVLIVPSEHFLTPTLPLAGVFQFDQARVIASKGINVGVISVGKVPMSHLLRPYRYRQEELCDGIPVLKRYTRWARPHRLDAHLRGVASYVRLATKLYRRYVTSNGRPDLIHAHNIRYAGLVACALAAEFRVPFVITEHSSEYGVPFDDEARRVVYLQCIRSARGFAAVSLSHARIIAMRLGCDMADIKVIPNVLPPEFQESPPFVEQKAFGSPYRFLNVAQLVPVKNQDLLLKAFSRAFHSQPVTLQIVGDGPLENALRLRTVQLGISGQVNFLGRLDRLGVRQAMREADAFVLCSNFESFGVVAAEAASQGLPVIATDCGGPGEIIDSESGYLVPVGSEEALAAAMIGARNDSARFSAAEISRRCRERFGPEALARSLRTFYAQGMQPDG